LYWPPLVATNGRTSSYFSRLASILDVTPGTARSSVDVSLNNSMGACPARPFVPFGTWTVMLP
jgi:hypothetical protein